MLRLWKSLVVAIAVSVLGACSWLQSAPPPDKPQVTVGADGKISVAPEPLDFSKMSGETPIVWSLPKDSPYRFAKAGIVVDDSKDPPVSSREEFVDWRVSEDGKTVTCRNVHRGKGRHKYTIYLRDASGKELPPFDPNIWN